MDGTFAIYIYIYLYVYLSLSLSLSLYGLPCRPLEGNRLLSASVQVSWTGKAKVPVRKGISA